MNYSTRNYEGQASGVDPGSKKKNKEEQENKYYKSKKYLIWDQISKIG